MDADKDKIETGGTRDFTKKMIENFFKQGRSSYAEG